MLRSTNAKTGLITPKEVLLPIGGGNSFARGIMKSVVRQLVEIMGAHQAEDRQKCMSLKQITDSLALRADDVNIAIEMMRSQGLIEQNINDNFILVSLNDKGLKEYYSYNKEG